MSRTSDAPLEPWDRQEDESPKAFAAFRQYLDLGATRSLRKLVDSPDRVAGWSTLSDWSSRFHWVERSRQWEDEQGRIETLELGEKVREMRRAHAGIGTLLISKAAQRLRSIDPETLSPREAMAMVELGSKLERQARGEPDHKIAFGDGSAEVLTSGRLWGLLEVNPHLADALEALDQAVRAEAGPPALGPGDDDFGSDDDVVDAEVLDEEAS